MKIGDFAKACGTRISVLRHYDKLGLLKPVYIDRFTEYRYYDSSQIAVFERIAQLKAVGLSLSEISHILYDGEHTEEIFLRHRALLERRLRDLDRLRENGGIIMKTGFVPLVENIDPTFENDERVVGKWLVLGEEGKPHLGNRERAIYFLPGGEEYWCYSWSKGKFIYSDGVSRFANDYHIEEKNDDVYMVIDLKSQDFEQTGETTPIALRKLDDLPYTKEQLARKDDVIKPFIPDERVIGKWKAYCFFEAYELEKADFVPCQNPPKGAENYGQAFYFKEIEFKKGGHVDALYADELISGDDKHTWTRGLWLRKFNSCACAYEIKEFDGKEYLIIEWKSGDYRYGGQPSGYYVMVRA